LRFSPPFAGSLSLPRRSTSPADLQRLFLLRRVQAGKRKAQHLKARLLPLFMAPFMSSLIF